MSLLSSTPTVESCDKLADKAMIQVESALTSLINAQQQAEEAVRMIDAQLDTLMTRKSHILKRSERLENMIEGMNDVLYPLERAEAVNA